MPAPAKQTKRRFGLLDFIRILLVLVILCALEVIAYRLWDYKTGTDRYDQLQQQAVQPVEETQEEGFVPLDIDFDALREEGPDIIGWIGFDSVEISYPIVYSGDNSYYLRRLWDGSYNQAGTLFLEGNNQSLDDLHAIVYGHNMRNGTMFGELSSFGEREFLLENAVVRFDTLYENALYVPFAIFEASMDEDDAHYFDVRQIVFDETSFELFVLKLRGRSVFDVPVEVEYGDQLLTLVTCSYNDDDGRYIVALRKLREGETQEEIRALMAEAR